ncbi:NACHT, LRR and PYD domains-containing protein 1 homolog [Danio aesculapii]|uniref:NACHT, LRR and PYD domains-containing protein 1 homolog n=1 Tax=Danio aesculapii TaxID=1142201 RepID=UPI0024C06C26|nr:NACHT, LRR and PYD domains-containing protein 1 homolog [Danio aesculapii]XP_056336148.1 NACHT, LRR and PYD domains-containing protein 1 homolog [Danio aesculapii]
MDQDSERARFVDAHWKTLVQKVIMVMPIADELLSDNMLEWQPYCKIRAAVTNQEKMRELYEVLHSGGDQVKSASYSCLEKHEPYLFGDLGCIKLTTESLGECLNKYKTWIQKEYEYVTEYNSLPGEYVLLSELFTQPLIIMRHRERREREEEMCSVGESFQQLLVSRNNADKDSSILDALFSADRKGISPNSVILQGNSGNGKSFTAQKIMLDWASGTLCKVEFGCLFHLKCKEVNRISGEQSLAELLSYNSNLTSKQISQILQKSPEKVLILIDGFDELRFSCSDVSDHPKLKHLSEKAPHEASLKALLMGHILSESFLLVTTRSTATKTLDSLLKHPQRFTEIMGFSEREVEEYFQKFFQNEQLFLKAYEYVRSNETLITACSIPVICWIICTVLRERFSEGSDLTSGLETTTSIYVDFVCTLLEHHSQGLGQPVLTLLRSLGQLAERGMLETQVLFEEKSVNEMVSDSPFLCKFLFKRRIRKETMFSFMHLSFQEFFTGLYYILLDEKEFLDKLTERFHSQTQSYLSLYLDKDFPLKHGCPEPHFLPVVQFLCGLSNSEVSRSLQEMFNLSVPSFVQPQLREWILDMSKSSVYSYLPFILHCLYELHEKEFVQKAMEAWLELDMSWDPLSRTDCWALLYCLDCCPHVRSLKLNFAATELKMLRDVLCRTPKLGLTVQNVSDTNVTDLLSALGEGKHLEELNLNSSYLSDQSVQQVLNALHKQKRVGGLQISVKSITADTALILSDVLQSKAEWEEISLRTNDVESLCSSLRLFSFEGKLVVNVVRLCLNLQNQPSLSEIILECPRSEASNIHIKSLTESFHSVNCITEESADFDRNLHALLSFLTSVSGLSALNLAVPFLTKTWASRILFLVESTPTLAVINFHAGSWGSDGAKWLPGLLLEEGIKLLKESAKRPECIVTIRGFRCSKSSERCSQHTEHIDQLSCNQRVTIQFCVDQCTEDIKLKLVLPDEN